VDHSHSNLCAWRGILLLHEITGKGAYLERARKKWDAALRDGYVWTIGGVGEHWYVSFPIDEGCSESDWLRFCLDLWRFTGEVRYLDVAERLLHNQYTANQCPNGGYGARRFDGGEAGPVATRGAVEEWPWCCSFHGPLGLHFLKSYLAAGSEQGVLLNFPLDFTTTVATGARSWSLAVRTRPEYARGRTIMELELAPRDARASGRTRLQIRVPAWASGADVHDAGGARLETIREDGYLCLDREFRAGEKLQVNFETPLRAEGRRFRSVELPADRTTKLRDVAITLGPDVLLASPMGAAGRPTLLASVDAAKGLVLPVGNDGELYTVSLPGIDASDPEIAAAIESGRPVSLQPWSRVTTKRRAAFLCDLVVVPSLSMASLARLAERAAAAGTAPTRPVFGADLEKRPDVWIGSSGWEFTPEGLRIAGGDVGLIDGEGYKDYRFEFELVLPHEGQGISGWVVRAQGESDCVMYQIQSADSSMDAPQFKTRPNTLRPHVRKGGSWTIADPVPLAKEVHKGEAHRIAVECIGERIEVFLDGASIHVQGSDLRGGAVGFRAGTSAEQGLFRRISLEAR
jgi:hypothetical protein